jgi:FkbH-like protein
MAKLKEFGIEEYFLYPQINWNSKASSVGQIAKDINIGLDTIAFIDDQPFEREEVAFTHDKVLCIDSAQLDDLLDRPEFNPRFITDDSKIRRQMYMADIRRNREEAEFVGPTEEFLATLDMAFTIATAKEEDLKRAEELTVRTHQLNTTGYTYSYEELDAFRTSPRHKLLISSLEDRHGTYGKIGLTLIECHPDVWTVKLLLMSCRVMSKGVGMIMIHHILREAKEAGVKLRAEFLSTDRNRQMLITYRFAGFKEVAREGDVAIMENDFSAIQPPPPYVDLRVEG